MKLLVGLSLVFPTLLHGINCQDGSIVLEDGKFMYKDGINVGALAYGTFNDSIQSVGWGALDITADRHGKYTGNQIMYAAGMLEGALTSTRINQQIRNMEGFYFGNRSSKLYDQVCDFLTKQQAWMKVQIGKRKGDPFWQFVGYVQSQIEGLYDGYHVKATQNITVCQIQFVNAAGDVGDIINAFERKPDDYFLHLSLQQLRRYTQIHGHCSALIKLTPGFENVFMAHNTWFTYSSMLRIYKHYNLKVFDREVGNSKMSFSSYPGVLVSLDDFYILGSGMIMLQTTNTIFNTSLYDLVSPESLLAWQRVRVANTMANDGREWGEMLKRFNSGTYNNQYMLIDLHKFKPLFGISDGALYVVEQIPGLVESHDQTAILREGYWASYNVPFYETIYNMSGYPALAKFDLHQTHDLAPRAKIFRRDQSAVNTLHDMMKLMRSNDYKHDVYSDGDTCNTICCRGDLQSSPQNIGCYDGKVTDFFSAIQFTSYAQSGPTFGGKSDLPPFAWTFDMPNHVGMPTLYNFPFVDMKPKYFSRMED